MKNFDEELKIEYELRDFLGKSLSVDDEVIFVGSGRILRKGKILRINPRTVTVIYETNRIKTVFSHQVYKI